MFNAKSKSVIDKNLAYINGFDKKAFEKYNAFVGTSETNNIDIIHDKDTILALAELMKKDEEKVKDPSKPKLLYRMFVNINTFDTYLVVPNIEGLYSTTTKIFNEENINKLNTSLGYNNTTINTDPRLVSIKTIGSYLDYGEARVYYIGKTGSRKLQIVPLLKKYAPSI